MFSELLSSWRKGAGHKYIRRKPYLDKKGRKRYRYTYKEHHGGGVTSSESMVEGSAFRLTHKGKTGHFHIENVSGDRLKIRHDESGGELELSKAEFQRLLHIEHGEALGKVAERVEAIYRQAKETGSAKQIVRARREAKKFREIAEQGKAPKPKMEGLRKSLLEKHQVSREQVEAALEEWAKSNARKETHPDLMYLRRLQRLERDGIGQAVETYNRALERAAQENAGVIAAVEAYREAVDPHNNPHLLNQIVDRKVEMLERYKKMLKRDGVRLDDYGGLTFAEMKKLEPPIDFRFYAGSIKRETGVDIKETGQTIREACRQLNPKDFFLWRLQRQAAEGESAQRKLEEVARQIKQTCKDLSFSQSTYTKGDMHPSHELSPHRKINDTNRESLIASAHYLAHVEDILQRSYPGREKHKLLYAPLSRGRTRAGCITNPTSSEMLLGPSDGLRTRVHELAHSLEGRSIYKNIPDRAYRNKAEREENRFAISEENAGHTEYQRAIQEAVTLTHLTRIKRGEHSKYVAKERTFDDEYHDVYTGKIYPQGSSELVTMGIQEMFAHADPEEQMKAAAKFATQDPHHFLVTYAILKGYTRHED